MEQFAPNQGGFSQGSDIAMINAHDEAVAVKQLWVRAKSSPVLLYGAGQTGAMIFDLLTAHEVVPLFFIDDTASKQGTTFREVLVLSLTNALQKLEGNDCCIITCIFHPSHRSHLTQQSILQHANLSKIQVIPFFSILLALDAQPFYFFSSPSSEQERIPIYQSLRERLQDSTSKRALDDHLRLRIKREIDIAVDERDDIPVPPVTFTRELTYIDAGAYDGDTVASFLKFSKGLFRKIFALEPDPENFARLSEWCNSQPTEIRERIEVLSCGLWHEHGEAFFFETGNMGATLNPNGNLKIPVTTLDQIGEKVVPPVMVKLDIEGAELEALSGAAEFCRKFRPIFSISVYHKPSDLVDAFLWLEKSGNNYQFGLRCHGGDGTDLTLYAW